MKLHVLKVPAHFKSHKTSNQQFAGSEEGGERDEVWRGGGSSLHHNRPLHSILRKICKYLEFKK